MAYTTLQSLISSIRTANLLDPELINFGWTDGLHPPYATVTDYSHEWEYDTSGGGVKTARFVLVVVGRNVDEAERTAAEFDGFLHNNRTLTPACIGCLQETWETGLLDPTNLYQNAVKITYTLFEGTP